MRKFLQLTNETTSDQLANHRLKCHVSVKEESVLHEDLMVRNQKSKNKYETIKKNAMILVNDEVDIYGKQFRIISDYLCLELLDFYSSVIESMTEDVYNLVLMLGKYYKKKRKKNNSCEHLLYYEGQFSAIADLYYLQIREKIFKNKMRDNKKVRAIVFGAKNGLYQLNLDSLCGQTIEDLDWMASNGLVLITNVGKINVRLSKTGRRILSEFSSKDEYYCRFSHVGFVDISKLSGALEFKSEEYYITKNELILTNDAEEN